LIINPNPDNALMEYETVNVYINADKRVTSVVTLTEEDDNKK
jgi:hypothetical protein